MTDTAGGLRRRLPVWLALIWLTALIIAYYAIHNPFSVAIEWPPLRGRVTASEVGQASAQVVMDLVAVALLILAAGALGSAVLKADDVFTPMERASLGALLGAGVISLAVLVMGLISLLPSRWLAWLITIAVPLILHRSARSWLGDVRQAVRIVSEPVSDHFVRWLRAGVVSLMLMAALASLAPPTSWDALLYHLVGPQRYLAVGRIVSYPAVPFVSFPQVTEIQYLWLMILARPNATGLLHWWFGALVIVIVLTIGHRVGRPNAGWLAACILIVADSLWLLLAVPYSDMPLMAFVTSGVLVLLIWSSGSCASDRVLLVAGAFIGLAMGTKYTAVGASVGSVVLAAWLSRRAGLVRMARSTLIMCVVALFTFAPWALKNTLLEGNPVAPFIWGMPEFDALDGWYYLRAGTGLDPVSLILAPIQGTVFGQEGRTPYEVSTGALLVPMLPLAALGWRRRAAEERTFILGAMFFAIPPYLIWLWGAATSGFLVQTRLLYQLFPTIALLGAVGLDGLRNGETLPPISAVSRGAMLIALVLALIQNSIWMVNFAPGRVLVGLESEREFLARQLGTHYLAMERVNELPAEARILFLWEPRSFYCRHDCIPDALNSEWWHRRQVEVFPGTIADAWREQGITHILIWEAGLEFLITEDWREPMTADDVAALELMRQQDLILLWGGPETSYSLYQLREAVP